MAHLEARGLLDQAAVADVKSAVLSACRDSGIHVLRGAVLADHVHLVISFRPDTRLSDFVRLVKSAAAVRANRRVPGAVRWARGFYAATLQGKLTDPGRKPGDREGLWTAERTRIFAHGASTSHPERTACGPGPPTAGRHCAGPHGSILRHQPGSVLGGGRSPLRAAWQPVLAYPARGPVYETHPGSIREPPVAPLGLRPHGHRASSQCPSERTDRCRVGRGSAPPGAKGPPICSPMGRDSGDHRVPDCVCEASRHVRATARVVRRGRPLGLAESQRSQRGPSGRGPRARLSTTAAGGKPARAVPRALKRRLGATRVLKDAPRTSPSERHLGRAGPLGHGSGRPAAVKVEFHL